MQKQGQPLLTCNLTFPVTLQSRLERSAYRPDNYSDRLSKYGSSLATTTGLYQYYKLRKKCIKWSLNGERDLFITLVLSP